MPVSFLNKCRILSSSFGIWIFSYHVVAYLVSFDSRFETRKSDIIRPRYELFNACGGSCPSLPCLWHYVTFLFTPVTSCFRNLDFFIPCRSLYRKLWIKHAMRLLLHMVGHVSHYVVFYTTLPYLFIHSSQLQFQNLVFFISCRSLYRKLWFKLLNSKIWYHTATLWAF